MIPRVHDETSARLQASGFAVVMATLSVLIDGCSLSHRLGPTAPPAVTQQLLIRSLERALARLDLTPFAGREVALQVWTQAGEQPFVRERIAAELEERGIHVVKSRRTSR